MRDTSQRDQDPATSAAVDSKTSAHVDAPSLDDLFAIVDAGLLPMSAAEEDFVLSLFAAPEA